MQRTVIAVALLAVAVSPLTGCTGLIGTATPGAVQASALQGTVHGGQQPIAGAHLYLFAANTTGYGNASISLLNAVSTGQSDSIGAYVMSDSSGDFSITNDYTCTPGASVYLYALGGNAGAGINSASGLLAALGACPAAGTFASATPFIWIDEVTTVAAAYAIAGFATDATHVSSSSTALARIGVTNAFANAANLANISTGSALVTTPAGNGTAPQATINTLANLLASCVNSTGPSSTPCSTLFANARSNGSFGTLPTDTATAAINIAHNPGSNIAALFGLATPAAPFAPSLSSQPNDFTLALTLSGGGLNRPYGIAIDSSGNAWVANATNSSVSEFSSSGSPISPPAGFAGVGGIGQPAIAIDLNSNAWITNENVNSVTELSSTGAALSPAGGYIGGGLNYPRAIAVDPTGNVWIANDLGNSITKLSASGVALSPSSGFTGGGLTAPLSVAIDSSGNVWASNNNYGANTGNGSITELSSSGSAISPPTGYTGGGLYIPDGIAVDSSGAIWAANYFGPTVSKLTSSGIPLAGTPYTAPSFNYPYSIAIDGVGNAWIGNIGDAGNITELSMSGASISPTAGYGPLTLNGVSSAVIDGSGNLWVASDNQFTITEFIGIAAPVVTPLAYAVKINALGSRP